MSKENKADENLTEEEQAEAQFEYENLKRQTQMHREHSYVLEIVRSFHAAKSLDQVEEPDDAMLTTTYQIARRAYELIRFHNIPAQQAPLLNALLQVNLKYCSLQTLVPPILYIVCLANFGY